MRILFITSRYAPHRGGLETVVKESAALLAARDHQVKIVTNRYPRKLPAMEVINDIPVYRLTFLFPEIRNLKSGRLDLFLAGFFYLPYTLIQLAFLIRRFRPEVVNLHYLGSPTLFVWLLKWLLRFPLVASLHGSDVIEESGTSTFRHWLFDAAVNQADAVTTCSAALLNTTLKLVPNIAGKSTLIHNGVNIDLFAHPTPYQHTRPYFLCVGRLVHNKGFDIVIAALANIYRQFPNIDLLIAGEGEQLEALGTQIQALGLTGRVKLLGVVTPEEVASLMVSAMAILIPSRHEAFGIVALEGLASGRPIFAHPIEGLLEALEAGEATWITPNDSVTWERALKNALEQAVQETPFNQHNWEVAQNHSWDIVADNYAQVLGTVVK